MDWKDKLFYIVMATIGISLVRFGESHQIWTSFGYGFIIAVIVLLFSNVIKAIKESHET